MSTDKEKEVFGLIIMALMLFLALSAVIAALAKLASMMGPA